MRLNDLYGTDGVISVWLYWNTSSTCLGCMATGSRVAAGGRVDRVIASCRVHVDMVSGAPAHGRGSVWGTDLVGCVATTSRCALGGICGGGYWQADMGMADPVSGCVAGVGCLDPP